MTDNTMTENRTRRLRLVISRDLLWPRIEDEASALDSARGGAVGGVMIVAALVIVLVLTQLGNGAAAPDAAEFQGFAIAQAIRIALAAFLTWRVIRGEGRFAAVALLLWALLVAGLQLVSGGLNAAWGLAWLLALLSLVHSVRGSWALYRLRLA